jgi:putative peptidoglycan lipid II flippase
MLVSFASIALNLSLNYLFVFRLGLEHRGLALSTTICATLNFGALYFLMLGPAGTLESRRFLLALGRCALAAIPLGLACWAGIHFAPYVFPKPVFWQRAVVLFATISVGALAYLASCLLLRVEETSDAARIALRKIRKKYQ